ncbi:MAG TPA: hypothetical protein VHN59_03265 [Chitinophagaceae bacterium]|nr:hypothetical protein [Chitinophagaceae bacterium]
MKLFIAWILSIGLCFAAIAQPPRLTGREKTVSCVLGDKKILIKMIRFGTNVRTVLINLHHNENTSLEAARRVLERRGGLLINIENDNERFISFSQNGRVFRFDPNRIFTDAGIKQDLEKQNDRSPVSAVKTVRRFARFICSKIPSSASTIIALHNNDDGNLSVVSYLPGNEYGREASLVHQGTGHDPDNFFFTTDAGLYRNLSQKGYNVVLQHNGRATDDGSLSVYYGRKKKSYVNVEAETGQLEAQERMLDELISLINR